MSTIRLTPYGEELLQKQLAQGSYRSREEVIERALENLAQKEPIPFQLGPATKSPAEAVADILELRKGVTLRDGDRALWHVCPI
jgi:Arc/MetJ-type ribon-helix-helix transcriptional regulator